MTLAWQYRGSDRFLGLWTNEVGHVLFIEDADRRDHFLVSFAPSKGDGPLKSAKICSGLSLRMPAAWSEDLEELVVQLSEEASKPSLHLLPETTGHYFDGPCLVPSVSTAEDKELDEVRWLFPLDPYRFVEEGERAEYRLMRILSDSREGREPGA